MTTMPDPARPRKGVIGGVDTHADVHVAAAIDDLGALLGTASFATDIGGYHQLHRWLGDQGPILAVGIEGTGSYGAGLARHLEDAGIVVHEVMRPDRSVRRRLGKSDAIDAEAAARTVLAGNGLIVPKSRAGAVEAVRVLRVARRSAVRARTQANNQMLALIRSGPEALRTELGPLRVHTRLHACAAYRSDPTAGDPLTATRNTLGTLARRSIQLEDEIRVLDIELAAVVPIAAPTLLDVFGVGTDTAGALLVAAGDNPERMHSEAAFAALCGVNPVPASSGKTLRHRLNRGGNREANSALWRIALVRLSHHQPTRDYAQRRSADGKTKKEIMRILKRYIAREVYPHLTTLHP